MSALPEIFTYQDRQVRTVAVDGEPWFVAADVCGALTLRDTSSALKMVDDDDQSRIRRPDTPHLFRGIAAQVQELALVNESGLYALIFQSNKPSAREFKRWITHEVIPALRRTGSYTPQTPQPRHEPTRRELAQYVIDAEDRAERAEAKAAELEPDAAIARRMDGAEGLELLSTVAKSFGLKEKHLRAFCHQEKLLIRGGSRHNDPMAHLTPRYFLVKERVAGDPPRTTKTTFVTPAGRLLMWRRLYKAGRVSSPRPPEQQLQLINGGAA